MEAVTVRAAQVNIEASDGVKGRGVRAYIAVRRRHRRARTISAAARPSPSASSAVMRGGRLQAGDVLHIGAAPEAHDGDLAARRH